MTTGLYVVGSGMRELYHTVCKRVVREGLRVTPRDQATKEIIDALLVIEDPQDSLPLGTNRNLHTAIGVAEALQMIAGVSDPRLMTRVSPAFEQFMDGGTLHGAYGPRLRPQFGRVVETIKQDRDTRQAVVTVWDPLYDQLSGARDVPCTVFLQFLVRKERLVMHTSMRSNDVWLGLPYDVFQFTQVQIAMAHVLGVEPGEYRHHAVSMHAYERDWGKILELREGVNQPDEALGTGLGRGLKKWESVRTRALRVLTGTFSYAEDDDEPPRSRGFASKYRCELRMTQILESYRG